MVAKHIEGTKRPQPQPPHTRGTFHRRLQPLYTEKHKVLCSGFLPTTHSMQHSCSHSTAIRNHSFKKRKELRTQEQPLLQNTWKEPNDRSRNRRTREVPFIAGCSHFIRKNARFCAPASSPQHTACNIHAASPMRSATTASRNAKNYAHRTNHGCKTHGRNQTTAAATAAHTRYLSSPAAATLHGKTQGFVLRLPPHNTQHATFMHPFNAIRNHGFKKRKELRTQEQPLLQNTWKEPFIAGCSHFTRKNTRFRAPASFPKHSPCNIHAGQFFCDVLLCSAGSHTTLHQSQFFSDVLL